MAKSVQINNSTSIPIIKNGSIDESGKVKIMAFDVNILKNLSSGEILELCYLPQGEVRILSINMFYSQLIEDATLEIGALDKENLEIQVLNEALLQITNQYVSVPMNNIVVSKEGITIVLSGDILFSKDFLLNGYLLYVED